MGGCDQCHSPHILWKLRTAVCDKYRGTKDNPSWSFVFAVVLGTQNIHVRLLYRRRGVVGLNHRKTDQNTGSSEAFHLFLRSHSVRGRIKQVGGILLHETLRFRDQALPLSRVLLYEVMSDHGSPLRPSAAS